jgi:hypothetical protein
LSENKGRHYIMPTSSNACGTAFLREWVAQAWR